MIHDLKPYPAYKDSGVPWLGEVPEYWEVVRCGRLFREVVDTGHHNAELLSIDRFRGIIRQSETGRKERASEDRSSYKKVLPGELAYNLMNAFMGSIGFSTLEGIISPAYAVARPLREIEPAYFHHLFRTQLFTTQFDRYSYGIMYERNRLYFERFKTIPTIIPSISEQSSIVHYLDYIDRRIRRYIHIKQKLIKLLEEQKQAVIHQAVTRGVDPNVRLKSSGVEWLGEVPEHWEIVSFRHLATKFGSGLTPRGGATVYKQEGIPFLRSQNIHFDGLRLDNVAYIDPDLHQQLSGTHIRSGDVLLNITGASIGRVCAVPDTFKEGNVNQHVCIVRPIKRLILPEYLAAYLSTPQMQKEIRIEQNGASREGLAQDAIRSFKILLPRVDEQRKIIQSIRQQTQKLISSASYAEDEISLLREYRTRLIADVVTGKLDVREAAANLPEETDEMEVIDNELAGDEGTTEEDLESEPEEET
jgi:type I restriction enzyme, S subunit